MKEAAGPNVVDQTLSFPGWITDLQIDLVQSTITYHVLEGYERRPHTIIFSGVTAFCYVRSPGAHRFAEPWRQELDDGTWAVSEWTSARYYPYGVRLTEAQAVAEGLRSGQTGRRRVLRSWRNAG